MIEIIGGAWAAGETKTFVINGEYLEILEAQYPCDVMLMDKSGAQLSIMRSSEASFFSRPKEGFQTIQITSATAQSIRVFIGSGDAGTRRISSTVQVVNGERARSVAGGAYAWRPNVSAVAGQVDIAQLWNPAGSGKRLIVDAMLLSTSIATGLAFWLNALPLTTVATGQPQNMLSGGPAIVGTQARYENDPALPVVAFHGGYTSQANVAFAVPMVRPFVVLPGCGLLIATEQQNCVLAGLVQFFEEAL
ncbi:hypothetical protein SRS16CHR_02713 [Variovorax sp. SRS16]|uniref:hypothetical protein n=1 Tax=Variovorax sp. SRS16 TaxID=282217 RepID=UPI001317477A|nr:hypothetical protein [Variovorax sp. SRS16]VTU20785.1 hypothetical protein SRS16CHR_02713 [Variovorax sp. SRS16]